jgi:hypothetical protein
MAECQVEVVEKLAADVSLSPSDEFGVLAGETLTLSLQATKFVRQK